MRKFFSKILQGIKAALAFSHKQPWTQCIVIGIVLNYIIEACHRHSINDAFMHIFDSPLPFIFNSLIISTALSLCTLSKKRYFYYSLVFALFLGFGIGNGVLLSLRITPLEWADLQVVKLSIIKIYLSTPAIIAIATALILALTALVILFIKLPKIKVNRLKNGLISLIFVVVLFSSLVVFRSTGILMSEHVKNIANAYKDYGFNYCFLCSALDIGIDKPSQYDKKDVSEIVDKITYAANENPKTNNHNNEKPNIIFLQLESFFDVNHLSKLSFSENPIPNFTELQNNYSTGYLTVPSIGAGTANTEFEVLSGMSLEHFGVGEYPYKTILKDVAGESICYNLAENGYKSHAIHNNTAVFYDRNIVFSNLGFNTFTSVEYMQNVEYNAIGWAKDNVLVGSINDALNSTDGSDFVYTISVQSHGKYPNQYDDELPIKAYGFENEETHKSFDFYINELNDVDKFIGDLLKSLNERDEKSVVVMFGDHLPNFDIAAEDLMNGDLFQTEYVIWDNMNLQKQNTNLTAYQLSANVLERIGIDNGILTKLHQNFANNEKYNEWHKVLEYDILYGEKWAFDGEENYPYKTTDLQLGVKEISITNVEFLESGELQIVGENFTNHSQIFINNSYYESLMIDNTRLILKELVTLNAGDIISVSQVDKENTQLSSTKNYIIGGTQENPNIYVDDENNYHKKHDLNISTEITLITGFLSIITVCIVIIILIKRKKQV